MGKARFFLTGSLLFLLVNFYLNFNQGLLSLLDNYLLEAWLVFVSLLFLTFVGKYFWWPLIVLAAILRFYYFIQPEVLTQNNFVYDRQYSFIAEIIDWDKKLNGWQLVVLPKDLNDFYGKVLVNVELYPEYEPQQIIRINCRLRQPEPIASDNGRLFFYDKYLAKDGIFATCYWPQVESIGKNNNFLSRLWSTQEFFLNNLNKNLVEPAGSLAKAMFFDQRREMSKRLQVVFSQTGLSHVVAISGSHIVIIVWLLEIFLLTFFYRQQVVWLIASIIIIYLWLIGFPSAAVRSAIMVGLMMLGPYLGRQSASIYGLLLTADILVWWHPYALIYDIGFQLSFLAVAGLIFYSRWWGDKLKFITERWKLREMVSVTLAAQMFVWPLIVYYFGIFSVVSVLANIFILPLLPMILLLGLSLALLGSWWWLAPVFSWPLFLLLELMIWLSEKFSQIPYAYFYWSDFSLGQLVVIAIFIIIFTAIIKPHEVR